LYEMFILAYTVYDDYEKVAIEIRSTVQLKSL
jgi:hypothetical protein